VDQSDFTKLTGLSLSSSQSTRFDSVEELASETLEELLGWPLDPNDWKNQYLEIGKTKDESDCLSADTSDLDDPDEVVGATRLYRWNPVEPYLFIDPATTIHAIKLVRDGITYKTFDPKDYSLKLENGRITYGRYIRMGRPLLSWMLALWPKPFLVYEHSGDDDYAQIAIDADWAFEDLPSPLLKVEADLIAYELDLKRDIKSETFLSHSYSRNARPDPVDAHMPTLAKYVGPNGTAVRPGVIV
jgi:hypothetical protein